jgi:glycosyltransferase involved in cell wall biosynthesis
VVLFIAPSNYIKNQMVLGGFPKEKIRVNHYGVDTSKIETSLSHDGSFLFVGRLSEEKGIDMIIHVAKLLPEITFNIVGRGPQMVYLHNLALDAKNVHFLGFRFGEELDQIYKKACAVLMPSRMHEVFPLVALESMAHGKPVVASDVGGVSEIVEDRVNGFLVQPTDLNGFAEAVLRLFHDTNLRDQMSRAARQTIEQKFRLDEHHRRLMEIYLEVKN